MKFYEKPIVITNDDVAEGVFLASGSSDKTQSMVKTSTQNWGSNGCATYSANVSGDGHVVLEATFDQTITNAWADHNCETSYSGKTVKCKFWDNAPFTATLNVVCENPDSINVKNVSTSSF
ncbi:MAG: hypothetical protein K5675_09850 [Lachnospiraceae bacterium]|nr:hypothetical protein [Lachnospiraceae bacterium]